MNARKASGVVGVLGLLLAASAACNGLVGNGDVELAAQDGSADATYVPGEGGSVGDEGGDAAVTVTPDAPSTVDTDAGFDAGEDSAVPTDARPDVDAGHVICPDGGAANACNECGPLDASPGAPCGAGKCGALECAPDGGGLACHDLSGQVGTACGANGCGANACSSDGKTITCSGDHAKNVCHGCGTITAVNGASATGKPNDPCGSCNSGQTYCLDPDTLSCIGATTNACGGCGTLAGTPNTACGTCSGTWTCSTDKSSVTCNGDHPVNACNGCSTLSPPYGTSCSNGVGSCTTSGQYVCSGSNATSCNAPAPPAPASWGTSPWNGSWDRNCDGVVEYSPSDSQFIPYSSSYPNDGPHWAISATAICATGNYPCNRGISNGTVSDWIYYPSAVETYPACGHGYIQFRCTLSVGACQSAENYCNGGTFNDAVVGCTIRNDVLRQCE